MKKSKGVAIPLPEMVDVSSISEAEYNPRTISPEMMASLKASIREHGLVVNLVVQRKGMVLVAGHQRLRAAREVARELGREMPRHLPCVVRDIGDADAKILNVALNRIAGDFDPFMLGELFASFGAGELTEEVATSMGFAMAEIEAAIAVAEPVERHIARLERETEGELTGFAKNITLSVEFASVAKRDAAARLLEKASGGKKAAGAFVLAALKRGRK